MSKKSFRFLAVDASQVSRAVITRALKEQSDDLEVIGVGNGEEALALAKEQPFDAVSTAQLLPGMSGIEFCRQLRKYKGYTDTPLVMISSRVAAAGLRSDPEARLTEVFDKTEGHTALADFLKTFLARGNLNSGHVLYVEDSILAMRIIRGYLENQGLEVTHVVSAEQALELITPHAAQPYETPYDLIISDYMLKGRMTGEDLVVNVRDMDISQRCLPVLVLTANQDHRQQVSLFRSGANDFVPKPVEEEVFMARVRNLMLLSRHARALEQMRVGKAG